MSVKGKEYTLLIKIAGAIDKSFGTSLSTAQNSLNMSVSKLNADFLKLDKGFDAVARAGKKCFKTIATASGVAAAAIGAVTGAAVVVGSSFESAFAGVKKTVDATEKEYATLRQNILDLSTEIPSSANEIAQTMEIAGQLGIATDSLTEFTKTMINLGVSTNLSAEDAATALARLANITGMADFDENGFSNWEKLGSTIVDLGNNFATTEAEIVAMSTKLASTGSIIGLTEEQILALATAMSSVGIRTEAGGSTMSKLLKKMQLAVENNGVALTEYAQVAGMTGEEFAQVFREDATQALLAFVKGLNDTERNGKSAVKVLQDMDIKEIRLSNTVLALANSTDVLEKALETSNKAWNDSTALAIEAGKRYETVGSQTAILGNSFKEAGVAIYDELRGPLVEVLSFITDKVQSATDYIKSSSGISKWLENISSTIPTVQRKIKKYGGAILDFFNPLIEIGKWFVKNPKVIVSTIAGIGGALATYKIASTTTHILNNVLSFISSASPLTFAITGVVTAIGALVGIYTSYKLKEREMIDNNLAEHFGSIKLSMADLQAVAEYIVSSESLGGVKKALDAFSDLDSLSATIKNSIDEIDKLNWKVSIGMQLTEDEQDSYKSAIAEYVSNAQEYALQTQYAVSLNLQIAFDEGDNVVDKVNKFYSDKTSELTSLGQQLNDAVTNAFNDGLLEIDEIDVIANLQKQMADIEKQLAIGELDAAMSLLGVKYSGANLDADSFQNLQAELASQSAAAVEAYQESYKKNYAALTASYNGGYLSSFEYNTALENLKSNLMSEIASVELRSLQFQINTINDVYGNTFNEALQKAVSYYSGGEAYKQSWGGENPALASGSIMWNSVIDKAMEFLSDDKTSSAVQELVDGMSDSINELNKLYQSWDLLSPETRQELKDTNDKLNTLQGFTTRRSFGSITGNISGLSDALANYVRQFSSKYPDVYGWVDSFYEDFSGKVAKKTDADSKAMYEYIVDSFRNEFSKGIKIDSNVDFRYVPRLMPYQTLPVSFGRVDHNANGGLITNTELSWLAEKGPEMVVPLDGSSRARSLWEMAGRLLGMGGRFDGLSFSGGNNNSSIQYSPTLQFYGGTPDKNDITDALRVSQDEFDNMMEQYLRRQSRMSFN